jgi:hypothetical protein
LAVSTLRGAIAHMSAFGTKRTFRHICSLSAFAGAFTDISNDQLVQAMAGFGGGAADTSATAPLSADTSQQTLLTTPQHK